MNKITIIGRLTADPQAREASGSIVCTFRLAAATRRKDENGEIISNFYNVDVWRATGESCAKYLHKGDRVCIVGDLTIRPYVDTKGQQRMSIDVTATEVEFLMDKREDSAPANKQTSKAKSARPAPSVKARASAYDEDEEEDDLPF